MEVILTSYKSWDDPPSGTPVIRINGGASDVSSHSGLEMLGKQRFSDSLKQANLTKLFFGGVQM